MTSEYSIIFKKKKNKGEVLLITIYLFLVVIISTATRSGTVLRPLLMYSLLNEVSYILSSYIGNSPESIRSALGPGV